MNPTRFGGEPVKTIMHTSCDPVGRHWLAPLETIKAVLATLLVADMATAQYGYQGYPLPLARSGLAYKTVSSLSHPGAQAVVAGPAPVVRINAPSHYENLAAPLAYNSPVVAGAPVVAEVAPLPVPSPANPLSSSQYHSQDEFGNYEYGYNNINSAKQERGNALGGVEGSYSYVDGHGLPQKVNYVADDYGFRVSGSNVVASPATLGRKKRQVAPLAYAAPYNSPIAPAAYAGYAPYAPIAAPVAPVAYATPVVSAPASRKAILTTTQLNPTHAVSYRTD
ncbi:hypothetical protein TCAL_17327 [Tigriopus californicus]|uniref:Cuticle protein 6 n=1 Tax=Tigriopus californicus TaxID=6832 RepID=A0A553P0H5_TIGCA|nr:hypothetical protein TCAL_17327 [Tigriopus californicus]